ncbi:RNA polymerase factor sigma C [Bacillus sp. V3-13]|uniref:sigma-70 family RNA polymerase sigma factor n=1 Tax=Bacillus sp. V3-13 TaxID=2053728 RepID=UPI000C761F6E|nr:sigma-70 family RNA polymerase sigma factor [Bacillus sp. V3-13]PLR78254.1 RNA polymerase factor sigma C [Bacillus sp. V3-13]
MQHHDTIKDLMDRYGTTILHLAYSFVKNRQTAEDLSQEIFIKCFDKIDTFEGNSNIQTWLYRIAVNHCKDYLKSWHYRKVHVSNYVSTLFTSQQAGPEFQYLQKSDHDELVNDIMRLPVKYREIIFLYYFHDLTLKEVSEVCGINLNTAKSRMSRAKANLKKHILERSTHHGQPNKRSDKSTTKG